MSKSSYIRPLRLSDLTKLKVILDKTQLFPSDMLEEMARPFFHEPDCNDLWYVYEYHEESVALLYCVKEQMTEGTWNVLALGVDPAYQGRGIGALLMEKIEEKLRADHQITLIVDTSSLSEYAGSRKFYERIGYHKEAVIRDFWSKGDDKVIFRKSLV